VIRRLYIHNFRCLENFELPISGKSSALLIGNNGSGKTTVGLALEILQRIARGTNRVGDLVKPKDLLGRKGVPMRFEVEVELDGKTYGYAVAFEFPEEFRQPRVLDEDLSVDGNPVYTRELGQVHLVRRAPDEEAKFSIDRQLAALPIIQQQSAKDPLFVFRQWLARMLILRPIPPLIIGSSEHETLEPNPQVTDLGAWFSGLLAHAPSAYTKIDEYLKQIMPDLEDIRNPLAGGDSRRLEVQFTGGPGPGSVCLSFEDLSDGEKCFMICALVLAANHAYGPLLCFWDEPDNYLAPSQVGHFVLALRTAFQSRGQFIATSHNPEAIRRFSDENTLVLYRKSHLEPTIVRPLEDLQVSGDLVDALIRGDVEP
jgi:hypothetical protein